jgi:hypothetical protein
MNAENPVPPKGGKMPAAEMPQPEPQRGGFFGWFDKVFETPANKTPEAKGTGSDKKSFGEKLLKLLNMQTKPATPADAKKTKASAERPTAPADQPEAAEKLSFAGRALAFARKMGQSTLDLLREERVQVRAADAKDKDDTLEPTDTEPLDKAQGEVREALDEVDQAAEKVGDGAPAAAATESGPSWDYKTHQATEAARVWVEVDRAMEEKRRRDRAESRVLGAMAMGTGLLAAGAGVANWLQIRAVRREQRQAKKRDQALQRQAEKTHEDILYNRQKLEELRHTQLEDLDRRQRQAHVYEVGKYAEAQAERIREVAKAQEKLAEKAVGSVVETPRSRAPEKAAQTETASEKRHLAERVTELVSSSKNNIREGLGGVIGGVVDLLTGRPAQPTPHTEPLQPAAQPSQPGTAVQTWLNGTLLILGVVLMIVILLAIG